MDEEPVTIGEVLQADKEATEGGATAPDLCELGRLNRLPVALRSCDAKADGEAVDGALHAAERRARLLGLGTSVRKDARGPEGDPIARQWDFSLLSDEELEREIRETLAAREAPRTTGGPAPTEQPEPEGGA